MMASQSIVSGPIPAPTTNGTSVPSSTTATAPPILSSLDNQDVRESVKQSLGITSSNLPILTGQAELDARRERRMASPGPTLAEPRLSPNPSNPASIFTTDAAISRPSDALSTSQSMLPTQSFAPKIDPKLQSVGMTKSRGNTPAPVVDTSPAMLSSNAQADTTDNISSIIDMSPASTASGSVTGDPGILSTAGGPGLPPPSPSTASGHGAPVSPLVEGSGSSSRGRHTCPHCNQSFTRHHNLKSHLLTHSHEKPFSCQTCQARFRRLHDLKRHSRLHTGERPHICPKCGRKFARGDALARHARGEGGCAGRRSSMVGSEFDGDDSMDMPGDGEGDIDMLDHDDLSGGSHDETLEERRRRSLPSIRTQDLTPRAHGHQQSGNFAESHHHHNTYPPLTQPPKQKPANYLNQGSLYPPSGPHSSLLSPTSNAGHRSTSPATSPNMLSSNIPSHITMPTPSSILGSQVGSLIESPRALSPGNQTPILPGSANSNREPSIPIGRARSPSYAHALAQNRVAQATSQRNSLSGPSPTTSTQNSLIPVDKSRVLPSQSSQSQFQTSEGFFLPQPPQHRAGSIDSLNTQNPSELIAYIHTLQDRINHLEPLEGRVQALESEVDSLKRQLAQQKNITNPPTLPSQPAM